MKATSFTGKRTNRNSLKKNRKKSALEGGIVLASSELVGRLAEH